MGMLAREVETAFFLPLVTPPGKPRSKELCLGSALSGHQGAALLTVHVAEVAASQQEEEPNLPQ